MNPSEVPSHLSAAFGQAIATTLSTVTGKRFKMSDPPAASGKADGELMVWQQPVSPLQGMLGLATGAEFSSAAGNMMLEAAGIEGSSPDEVKAAWHEVAGQALGELVSLLSKELKCEFSPATGVEVRFDPAPTWTPVGIQGPAAIYRVLVSWPASLAAMYTPKPEPAPAAASLAANSSTFDLLLDVALPVAVSFGRTALQIREVLKLNTGSIIELNRLISEPVDVVVNDSIIARGEVVVVDGNYGVRITQIASREDRLLSGLGPDSVQTGVAA